MNRVIDDELKVNCKGEWRNEKWINNGVIRFLKIDVYEMKAREEGDKIRKTKGDNIKRKGGKGKDRRRELSKKER